MAPCLPALAVEDGESFPVVLVSCGRDEKGEQRKGAAKERGREQAEGESGEGGDRVAR